MNNCLAKKLKRVVENDTLSIMGALYIGCYENVTNKRVYIDRLACKEANKSFLKVIGGTGTITVNGSVYNLHEEGFPLGTNTFPTQQSIYITSNSGEKLYVYVTNMYNLKEINVGIPFIKRTFNSINDYLNGLTIFRSTGAVTSENTQCEVHSFTSNSIEELFIYNVEGEYSYTGELDNINVPNLRNFQVRQATFPSLQLSVNIDTLTSPYLEYIRLSGIIYKGSIVNIKSININTIRIDGGQGTKDVKDNHVAFAETQVSLGRNSGTCLLYTIGQYAINVTIKFGTSMENPTEAETAQGYQIVSN